MKKKKKKKKKSKFLVFEKNLIIKNKYYFASLYTLYVSIDLFIFKIL